jgi:hypothetical protein
LVPPGWFTRPAWAPSMTIPLVIGVNPLQTTLFQLGIVSGRVALLLRSAEIHPVLVRFVKRSSERSPPLPLPLSLDKSREGSRAARQGCKYLGDFWEPKERRRADADWQAAENSSAVDSTDSSAPQPIRWLRIACAETAETAETAEDCGETTSAMLPTQSDSLLIVLMTHSMSREGWVII